MARRNLEGLRIVITGASQGIGKALALEAAKRGMNVVAAARSADLLYDLASEAKPGIKGGRCHRSFGQERNVAMCAK